MRSPRSQDGSSSLDEKYKEASKDELQRVMKDYFYVIVIKEGEAVKHIRTSLQDLTQPTRPWSGMEWSFQNKSEVGCS